MFIQDADFTGRTAAVEEKLKAFEKLHPQCVNVFFMCVSD